MARRSSEPGRVPGLSFLRDEKVTPAGIRCRLGHRAQRESKGFQGEWRAPTRNGVFRAWAIPRVARA
jgi:hypothetical protein